MCKVCGPQRGPRPLKCFDKHQVKIYKDIDELKELVCFDCVDADKFTGADGILLYTLYIVFLFFRTFLARNL